VAHVRDGNTVQQNIVHVDGSRAVLSTVLKNGQASTIDVVNGIKNVLPLLRQQLPDALKIDVLADQSLFVKAAINGVVREGAIAAGLTSLMILFFLGSWRSTIIIATSIPLAVLCALMGLWADWRWRWAFWSTTPLSPSRTSTGTWSTARASMTPSWTAPARSPSRPLSRCSASASVLCRCSPFRA
jgi:hypothetical protein